MQNREIQKKNSKDNKDALIKPDEETLHTTDPQENMEGPLSSLMQSAKEEFEENDDKDAKMSND